MKIQLLNAVEQLQQDYSQRLDDWESNFGASVAYFSVFSPQTPPTRFRCLANVEISSSQTDRDDIWGASGQYLL
ncbi:TPA: mobilization protein [Klebsiella pneumoniae]|nr:mobilization protein [Klebsiella quasipneumoniae]PLO39981.1 mobilization protein [Klebsiella pneumoniae]HBV3493192.1 mobilization protein [Klebsiella pneumoniae]HCU0384902.1 mobilization protein [Klebsiella pneumoniae]